MDVVLNQLDTVSDFIDYLSKKEALFRSGKHVLSTGEEELLGYYLTHLGEDNEYGFHEFENFDAVGIEEGHWQGFLRSESAAAQKEANRISYAWDAMIEKFSHHLVEGTQYVTNTPEVAQGERMPRWLAREKRTRRRMLARKLYSMIRSAVSRHQASIVLPSHPGDPLWVFLVMPHRIGLSYREYREARRAALWLRVHIAAHLYPHIHDVCGIATNAPRGGDDISEDFIYLDTRSWSRDQWDEAETFYAENNIFKQTTMWRGRETDYSEANTSATAGARIGRNAQCPCGSGKKYKHCCMRRFGGSE